MIRIVTYAEAIEKLKRGAPWHELVEAVGVAIQSPECSELDLLLALRHGGVVAEQAALSLYRITGRGIPVDRTALVTSLEGWIDLICQPLDLHTDRAGPSAWSKRSDGELSALQTATEEEDDAQPIRISDLIGVIAAGFSLTERQVFVLISVRGGLGLSDIGRSLGISKQAVQKILCDIVTRLRERARATDALT